MQSVRDTASDVLRDLLTHQPDSPAKVAFAYRMAAGAALARASIPAWTPDGTLRVRPATAAWQHELRRARPMIAERLKQMLGADVVRTFVIEAPEPEEPGRRRRPFTRT
jgi:Dna[CI] antecedent, DciA